MLIGMTLCLTACPPDPVDVIDHSVIWHTDTFNGDTIVRHATMHVGATTKITSDGKKHQWQSQNPEVAKIENDSTIRAIAVGNADIKDNTDAKCRISVTVIE